MDIPDFDELEWLESHTLDNQFDEDFVLELEPPSPPSSPPSDKPAKKPTLPLPPKPSQIVPQFNPNSKKRAASDLPKSVSLDVDDNYDLAINGSDGKRSRTVEEQARTEKYVPDVGQVESDEMVSPKVVANGNVDSVTNEVGSDDDEEWLRYSPPQDTVEEMEVGEGEAEEKILSRFASEIDGDFVPVTGLDGERVYAKVCSVEIDEWERNKKFNSGGDLNGKLIFFHVT